MEETIIIGAKVNEEQVCSNCEKTVPGSETYCFKGNDNRDVYLCSECKANIDVAFEEETKNPNYLGAAVLGIIAGIISGLIWYLIEATTGYQIGYIALGAGYLISWAVILGSGRKRGFGLQLISAGIALFSICSASYLSTLHRINQYLAEEAGSQIGIFDFYLWISPFEPDLVKMIISPIGLLIWGIGIYIAFRTPQANEI